jgi:hypothetical protein
MNNDTQETSAATASHPIHVRPKTGFKAIYKIDIPPQIAPALGHVQQLMSSITTLTQTTHAPPTDPTEEVLTSTFTTDLF